MRLKSRLNHKIWALAAPMIISNISLPLLGLVDTAILGHLDSPRYLAAVAIGASLMSFLYWGFGFLRMGSTGLAAQAFGRGDRDGSQRIIAQSAIIAVAIGIAVWLLSYGLLPWGLALMAAGDEISELALSYCEIRIYSAPAVMLNYAIIGWMIGHQDTRSPLLIAVATNALNILLDLIFIVGLGLASDGAALATLIAEILGCVLAIFLLQRRRRAIGGRLERRQLWHWPDYRRLLLVNRQLFVRTLLLLAAIAFFTRQGAQQGEIILAANTLLMQLVMFSAYGMDGFAHAAEALTGSAIGRRRQRLFIHSCRQCCLWSLVTAGLFSLLFAIAGEPLLGLLSSIPEVVTAARQYLPWVVALPLLSVWSYVFDGIFIGATRSHAMQYTMIVSVLLVYLPCWYLSQNLGNHGLWLSFCVLNGCRGLSLGLIFLHYSRRKLWIKH